MTLNEFLKWVGAEREELETEFFACHQSALRAVSEDGYALKYVKEQTPEICKAAVSEDGNALKYVKEQTPEICKAAVSRNGYALKYVKEQTPEICKVAVSQNGDALRYVRIDTFENNESIIEIGGKKYKLTEIE